MLFVEPAPHLHTAGDAIGFAINANRATANELCRLMGCSDSTLSRYRNGESSPSADQVALIVRHHPDPWVKMLFVGVMCATTPIVLTYADADFGSDVDGNGKVDLGDAVCEIVKAMKATAATLERICQQHGKGRASSPVFALECRTEFDEQIRLLSSAARRIDEDAAKALRRGGR